MYVQAALFELHTVGVPRVLRYPQAHVTVAAKAEILRSVATAVTPVTAVGEEQTGGGGDVVGSTP